jgi:hypothetical protein
MGSLDDSWTLLRGQLHDCSDIETKIVQSFAGVRRGSRKNIPENDLLKNLIRP